MKGATSPGPWPPRLAEALLRAAVRDPVSREGLLGDLHERHARLAERRSSVRAAAWYWRQALRGVFVYGIARLRGEPAVAGLRGPGPVTPKSSPKETAMIDTLVQDLRYALRSLRSSPGFAAVAVLTLGLGIGVNAGIFSVVNAFLFRPLPVAEPDELVVVAQRISGFDFPLGLSYPNYLDYRSNNEVLSDLALYFPAAASVELDGPAGRIWLELVSGNYFDMLGVDAHLGRTFSWQEAEALGSAPVMVLSHGYWEREFGADPSVIGRTVRVNGHPFTIIGVTPEGFTGAEFLVEPAAFVPATMLDVVQPSMKGALENRGSFLFRAMGRLRDGVGLEQARDALGILAAEVARRHPEASSRFEGLVVVPETQARPEPSMAGTLPPVAAVMMGLVGLVLLIACANVANLLLARASGRSRELAVRAALGAGVGRIVRQLLSESVVLGLAGAAVGVGLAYAISGYLASMLNSYPMDFPIHVDMGPDVRVFAFTAAVAVLTGLIAGCLPALQSARQELVPSLKEGGRGSDGAAGKAVRSALVVVQVAVSLVLLVAGGLFARSLGNVHDVDLGFRTDDLLMVSVDPTLVGYGEVEGRQLYERIVERVEALPGVRSASFAEWSPFGGRSRLAGVVAEGRAASDEDEVLTLINSVGADYFHTVGTRIQRGRGFTERDTEDAPAVAVVTETMAERLWPGEDPLGKRFSSRGPSGPWIEVVGVAEDGRYIMVWEDPRPKYFVPEAQRHADQVVLYALTEGDPLALASTVRREIRTVDEALPVYDVKSMEVHLRDGNAFLLFRVAAVMVGAFGLLGLALAAVGLYGLISYTVSRRRQEIGVRMALGAGVRSVLGLVVRQGLTLTGIGLGLGLLASFLLTRPLSAMLIGVGPTDPLTIGLVAAFLLLVALVASYVPARRAAKVDPVKALRDS